MMNEQHGRVLAKRYCYGISSADPKVIRMVEDAYAAGWNRRGTWPEPDTAEAGAIITVFEDSAASPGDLARALAAGDPDDELKQKYPLRAMIDGEEVMASASYHGAWVTYSGGGDCRWECEHIHEYPQDARICAEAALRARAGTGPRELDNGS